MNETTLHDFLQRSWNGHADDAEGVMDRLPGGVGLVARPITSPRWRG